MRHLGLGMLALSYLKKLEINFYCNHLGVNGENLRYLGVGIKGLKNSLKILSLGFCGNNFCKNS